MLTGLSLDEIRRCLKVHRPDLNSMFLKSKNPQQVVQGWPAGLSQANILSFPPPGNKATDEGILNHQHPPQFQAFVTLLSFGRGWHWPLRFSWRLFSPSIHRSFLWPFFPYRLRKGWDQTSSSMDRWKYLGFRRLSWIHPGRLTAGTYSHHSFRKENDLNQTSMIVFHVNLQGCRCSGWK